MCLFDMEGELSLAGNVEITVFAVGKDDLPPDSHALLGNKHLRELRVSLDFAQNHPYGSLVDAIAFGRSLVFSLTLLVTSAPSFDSTSPFLVSSVDFRWWFCGVSIFSFGFALVIAPQAQQGPTIEPRVFALYLVVPFLALLSWLLPESSRTLLGPLVRPPVWARTVTPSALAPDTSPLTIAPTLSSAARSRFDFTNDRLAHVLAHNLHNLTPQLGFGGISPYEAVYGKTPPPLRIYRDYSYPPNTTRRVSTFAPTSPFLNGPTVRTHASRHDCRSCWESTKPLPA
jgi:hypothetical protein